MAAPEAASLFPTLHDCERLEVYNYKHFFAPILAKDARRTVTGHGIKPGELAPDFELPAVNGGTVRLSDLRGKPVLLHFTSFS